MTKVYFSVTVTYGQNNFVNKSELISFVVVHIINENSCRYLIKLLHLASMRTSRFLWSSLLLLYLARNFSFIVFRHYPSPLCELLLGLPLRAFIHFCTFSPSRCRVISDTFILTFHYLPNLYLFFFLFIFELLIGSHWSLDVFYYCCCCCYTLSATDLIGLFFALRWFLPYTPWYLLFYCKWFRFERMFFFYPQVFFTLHSFPTSFPQSARLGTDSSTFDSSTQLTAWESCWGSKYSLNLIVFS